MDSVIGLALYAAIYPTLFAAVTVMLLTPSPRRLMVGYVLGAYTISLTLGLLIVFPLDDSSAVDTSKHSVSPAMQIGFGLILLLVAFVLKTGRDKPVAERRKQRKEAKRKGAEAKEPWTQRTLGGGSARLAFAVGVALSLPSVSYLLALQKIHDLGYSTAGVVAVVVGFNVIMFLLIELPLLGYLISPEWTKKAVDRFRAWLGRSGRRAAVFAFTAFGGIALLLGTIGFLS